MWHLLVHMNASDAKLISLLVALNIASLSECASCPVSLHGTIRKQNGKKTGRHHKSSMLRKNYFVFLLFHDATAIYVHGLNFHSSWQKVKHTNPTVLCITCEMKKRIENEKHQHSTNQTWDIVLVPLILFRLKCYFIVCSSFIIFAFCKSSSRHNLLHFFSFFIFLFVELKMKTISFCAWRAFPACLW